MTTGRLVVLVNALVFGLYGLLFMAIPGHMSDLVTGGIPATASAMIDMRATYGGMSLAMGLVLFMLGARRDLTSTGLAAVVAVMLGMAGGRLIGMIVDGDANPVMYIYLALELVMAGFAAVLLPGARRA